MKKRTFTEQVKYVESMKDSNIVHILLRNIARGNKRLLDYCVEKTGSKEKGSEMYNNILFKDYTTDWAEKA